MLLKLPKHPTSWAGGTSQTPSSPPLLQPTLRRCGAAICPLRAEPHPSPATPPHTHLPPSTQAPSPPPTLPRPPAARGRGHVGPGAAPVRWRGQRSPPSILCPQLMCDARGARERATRPRRRWPCRPPPHAGLLSAAVRRLPLCRALRRRRVARGSPRARRSTRHAALAAAAVWCAGLAPAQRRDSSMLGEGVLRRRGPVARGCSGRPWDRGCGAKCPLYARAARRSGLRIILHYFCGAKWPLCLLLIDKEATEENVALG